MLNNNVLYITLKAARMDQFRVQYLVREAMHAYRERQLKLRE